MISERRRPSTRSKRAPVRTRSARRAARHLRLVTPPRRRRPLVPFVLVSSALVGALVLGVVSIQAMASQTSFRMQDLAARNAALRQRYGELRLEIAELSAPGRIANEARRLGLTLPDSVHTIAVSGAPEPEPNPDPQERPSFALKDVLGGSP